jgi:hypothetical protein
MFIGLKVVKTSSRGVSWREVHKYRFLSGLAAYTTYKGIFQIYGEYLKKKIETYRTEDINPLPFFTKLKKLKKEEKTWKLKSNGSMILSRIF